MENLRNRCTVDLVTSEGKLKKLAAQPSFKKMQIFHENLVAVEQAKVELTLKRPIYVGFAILDLSKTLMYNFYYNYIKQKCSDPTLHLLIQIPSFIKFKRLTCTKTFMLISPCLIFLGTRKKAHSIMMDKLNWEIYKEFVSLRAKMYSLKTKKEEMKKAKRGKKSVVKKDISHQDYVDCLFEERKYMHTMRTIRSSKHLLYTIKQNKVSLSPYYDKRYLVDDWVSSLPYGNCSLL